MKDIAVWHKLWTDWDRLKSKLGVENTIDFLKRIQSGALKISDLYYLVSDENIEEIKSLLSKGISIVPITSPEYPPELKEYITGSIYPPLVLYLRGSLEANKRIAIVGTRFCTNWGRSVTRKIVRKLVDSIPDVTIVTGFARGIDTEAVKASLDFNARAIGVLPWLMSIYPLRNERLAEQVVERGGALVSENLYEPASSKEIKQCLFLRNRIISSISKAIIVIEARLQYVKGKISGGAMWQVEYALKKNKKVFILKPRYKAYKRGGIWVNYEEAYKYFVKNGAIGFSESEIEGLIDHIKEILN